MATDIIVEPTSQVEDEKQDSPESALVSYVMGYVQQWRTVRDTAYKDKWDDYYHTWRGNFRPESRQRRTERSKIISPASQMAVDLTVAEIIEALFAREQFFDLPDNIADEDKSDAIRARDQLLEDLYRDGIIKTMVEIVLNGALYGTGIAKINIDVETRSAARIVQTDESGRTIAPRMVRQKQEVVRIYPSSIEPGQLVVDPSAASIDDMLGVAHEFKMPLHKIQQRQRDGTYFNVEVGPSASPEEGTNDRHEGDIDPMQAYAVNICEWHGLVPAKLLAALRAGKKEDGEPDPLALALAETADDELIEAIVTIANEGTLLRAIPNPSVMDDRAILAYQHDTVPNRFWGRGVMEKGRNPQKALDAEMRARADALAWINNPMLAFDQTRLPPRMNINVWPGKAWATIGNPNDILKEFRFGDINASSFQQTAELERMVQDATGARDPATLRQGVRDEASTAAGIAVSGILKRAKRTMFNIEEFLTTMIRRILWRKMQFEPDRFPVDVNFQVKGTAGIMAREIEQQLLVNMLQFVEQGTPPYLVILKAIFDQSSSPRKAELVAAVDQMLRPPSEEEQQMARAMQQLQMQGLVEKVRNLRADTALKLAQGDKAKAEALLRQIEAEFKDDEMMLDSIRLQIDVRETDIAREQNQISREKLEVDRERVAAQKAAARARASGGGSR